MEEGTEIEDNPGFHARDKLILKEGGKKKRRKGSATSKQLSIKAAAV